MQISRAFILATLGTFGCAATATVPAWSEFRGWGTFHEVLREGHTEARARVLDVAQARVIGVGALEGLSGEVTIVDGRALVSTAVSGSTDIGVRPATTEDQATLLHVATVANWSEIPLPPCATYAALETAIASELAARGMSLTTPTPVRIRGRAVELVFHVIAGACPIANPDGPPPARYVGTDKAVELVGFFADDAAGRFTHHNRRSHLHAVTAGGMGHLDEVHLGAAVLMLPRP